MYGEDEVSAIANFLSESGQLVSVEFSSPGECQTRRIRVPNRKTPETRLDHMPQCLAVSW
jgi:hypothetical protein